MPDYGSGYRSAGNPSGYRGSRGDIYAPGASGFPPEFDGSDTTPPPDLHSREATTADLARVLATVFGPGCAVGLEAFIERLTRNLVAELRNSRIGARLPAFQAPPVRAAGMFDLVGVDSPIPLPPVGAAGAFSTVLTLAPPDSALGAVWAFGHALSDITFWPTVEHQILVGGSIFMGPWTGQVAAIETPLRFPGIPLNLDEKFVYQARNVNAAGPDVNVMAVGHGYSFRPPTGHYEAGKNWQSFEVDGG